MLKNRADILASIKADSSMMAILHAVQQVPLTDCWVAAGFVRSKIWDVQHGFIDQTSLSDVDVVYFDKNQIDEAFEKEMDQTLHHLLPNVPWSVKNQARMHLVNQFSPYQSTEDAISHYPETATALAVRLDDDDQLELLAPWGVEDAIELKLRPTSAYSKTSKQYAVFKNRINKKQWKSKWPGVKEVTIDLEN